MKLIFLDVDGVLNNMNWHLSLSLEEQRKRWANYDIFSPENVSNYNTLVNAVDCKTVISSTWRVLHLWDDLMEIFKRNNIITDNIIGKTPDLFDADRGDEIQEWLDTECPYNVSNFVIIDDNSDMAHLKNNLVLTDPMVGLTKNDVAECIVRLNE